MDGITEVSPDLRRQYASAEPGTIGGASWQVRYLFALKFEFHRTPAPI